MMFSVAGDANDIHVQISYQDKTNTITILKVHGILQMTGLMNYITRVIRPHHIRSVQLGKKEMALFSYIIDLYMIYTHIQNRSIGEQ